MCASEQMLVTRILEKDMVDRNFKNVYFIVSRVSADCNKRRSSFSVSMNTLPFKTTTTLSIMS